MEKAKNKRKGHTSTKKRLGGHIFRKTAKHSLILNLFCKRHLFRTDICKRISLSERLIWVRIVAIENNSLRQLIPVSRLPPPFLSSTILVQ